MPVHTGPNLGMHYGYTDGENGWGANLTADLKKIDTLLHGRVKNRSTNAPPGTPSDGDRYIVGQSPTGAWISHANHVAVYDGLGAAWVFYAPAKLWQIHSEDDGAQYVWNGTAWAMATCVEAAYFANLQDAVDAAAVNGAVVHIPRSSNPVAPYGYWGGSSPAFTGLEIPGNVRVRCDPGTLLSFANYLGDSNKDMVQINGGNAGISGCSILGTNGAGTGCGIHINGDALNPLIGAYVEDVDIWNTSSWNVKITPVSVETHLTRVFMGGAVAGGCVLVDFDPITGANSQTRFTRCSFNSAGYGTFGGGIERGQVHIVGAMSTEFHHCGFQPLVDSAFISLESTCHQVSVRDCAFYREIGSCTKYMLTVSGSSMNVLLDGVTVYDVNTDAVRLYKSWGGTGGCYDLTMSNVICYSGSDPGGVTDIVFGSGTDDHLTMENVRSQCFTTGAERRLRVTSYANVLRLGNMGAYSSETARGAPLGLPTDSLTNIKAWADVHAGDMAMDATNNRLVIYTGSKWQYPTMNDA